MFPNNLWTSISKSREYQRHISATIATEHGPRARGIIEFHAESFFALNYWSKLVESHKTFQNGRMQLDKSSVLIYSRLVSFQCSYSMKKVGNYSTNISMTGASQTVLQKRTYILFIQEDKKELTKTSSALGWLISQKEVKT